MHSAAEYLIKNNYTTAKKIILNGGSNGGFVTLASGNQRPDLFGALVSQVPYVFKIVLLLLLLLVTKKYLFNIKYLILG